MAPKFWWSGRFVASSVVKTARSGSDVLSLRENPFGHFVSRSRTGGCDPEHRDYYAQRDENCGIERSWVGGSGE